ncbi:hypothetical protein D3C86_1461090 [compost metagenome]
MDGLPQPDRRDGHALLVRYAGSPRSEDAQGLLRASAPRAPGGGHGGVRCRRGPRRGDEARGRHGETGEVGRGAHLHYGKRRAPQARLGVAGRRQPGHLRLCDRGRSRRAGQTLFRIHAARKGERGDHRLWLRRLQDRRLIGPRRCRQVRACRWRRPFPRQSCAQRARLARRRAEQARRAEDADRGGGGQSRCEGLPHRIGRAGEFRIDGRGPSRGRQMRRHHRRHGRPGDI